MGAVGTMSGHMNGYMLAYPLDAASDAVYVSASIASKMLFAVWPRAGHEDNMHHGHYLVW